MDKERINEILAGAIADGKDTIEYMAVLFAESFYAHSFEALADTYEEIGDRAYDAGIAIREMALALETLGAENLDEDCGKD